LVVAFALSGLCLIASSGFAQEDIGKRHAEELLQIMEVSRNMEQALAMMKQMQMEQIQKMIAQKDISEGAKEAVSDMQSKMLDMVSEELNWQALKDDVINVYREAFTASELKELVDFYKTPIGAKFISKQPELMQKMMMVSQRRMGDLQPKIMKIADEMMKALKEIGEKEKQTGRGD